jgi:transcriptional regulator with XRE-family HTH domain
MMHRASREVAAEIQRRRQARRLTYGQLARACQRHGAETLTEDTLINLLARPELRGRDFTIDELLALAEAFGTSITNLWPRKGLEQVASYTLVFDSWEAEAHFEQEYGDMVDVMRRKAEERVSN